MQNTFAQLEARGRRDFKRHARKINARKEPARVLVYCGLALAMLFDEDERVAKGVAELMAMSFGAATGEIAKRECFGCLAPWSLARAPVGAVLVEFLDGSSDYAMLAGLCRDCTGQNDTILAAVKRDFGDDFKIVTSATDGGTA